MPYMEFLFPAFTTSFPTITTKLPTKKIKQTTNTNIHNNQMLSVDMFPHVCVCESVQCPSHSTKTRALTLYGGLQTKHTHTHVGAHRSAHLCCNPLILQYTASVHLQFVWRIVGGVWVLFVVWVRGARRRDRWRGGVKRRRRWRFWVVLSCSGPLCRWPAPACSSVSVSSPARPAPMLTRSGERGERSANATRTESSPRSHSAALSSSF